MADVSANLTKRCTKCGEVKALPSFYNFKHGALGKQPECKDCSKKRSTEWRVKNRKRSNESRANWEKRHPEVRAAYRALPKRKEYTKAFSAAWYERNRERLKEIRARWHRENYPRGRKEKMVQAEANRRARQSGATGTVTLADVWKLYGQQRGLCATCRCSLDGRFHRDHVVPLVYGGTNSIDNIQLLCGDCNRTKGPRSNAWLVATLEKRNG
mgnify:FL=1